MRFTLVFYAAYKVMPPPTSLGPPVWDHSYYALVWHTLHWQQILYQLRLLPHASRATRSDHVTSPFGPGAGDRRSCRPEAPRFEFWWLRARDLGTDRGVAVRVVPDRGRGGRRARCSTAILESASDRP